MQDEVQKILKISIQSMIGIQKLITFNSRVN